MTSQSFKYIGFTGKAGAGKDTAGAFLTSLGYKRLAFADPLKEICRDLFELSEEQLRGSLKTSGITGSDFIKDGVTPRKILQFFGTDIVRNQFGEILKDPGNFWIRQISKRIIQEPETPFIFTDVRFENEAKFIHDLGGIIIKIRRPSVEKEDSHETEKGISGYDYEVVNDDLDEFKKDILRIVGTEISNLSKK